ncbi:MAG: DUF962 domain-containing protein [Acidobacteriota bacterium]
MISDRFQSFEEFWPFYIREHSLSTTRVLHFIGTTCGLIAIMLLVMTAQWWWLPIALVISYGFAWFSHFFIEKNRPATFTYPLYSLRADFRMYGLMWRGQMGAEIARLVPELR